MTKFLVAAAFCVAFASVAAAQTSYPIPPRDPPFGRGNLDNNTEIEPNRNPDETIPPRDPPFGKGELRNDPVQLPSSAVAESKSGDSSANGGSDKSAKSRGAKTKSASKKDHANATKSGAAPKNDTD